MIRLRGRTQILKLFLVTISLIVTSCTPTEDNEGEASAEGAELPDEIVIGATLPLTGEESALGGFFKQGYGAAGVARFRF